MVMKEIRVLVTTVVENKETKLAIWENYLIYSLILNVETSAIMQLNKAYPNLIKNY